MLPAKIIFIVFIVFLVDGLINLYEIHFICIALNHSWSWSPYIYDGFTAHNIRHPNTSRQIKGKPLKKP
jgi:hypothetical protein